MKLTKRELGVPNRKIKPIEDSAWYALTPARQVTGEHIKRVMESVWSIDNVDGIRSMRAALVVIRDKRLTDREARELAEMALAAIGDVVRD